jgi:DNA polymerase (family 10)
MKRPNDLNRAFMKAMTIKMSIPFHVEIAGSIRRGCEVVGDLDLVAVVPDFECREHWATSILGCLEGVEIHEGGPRRASGSVDGFAVNLWCCLEEEFGACLFYATGPKGYNIAYRRKAKAAGWLLNEKGLWDEQGHRIAGHDECSIYNALGREWKDPSVRGYRPVRRQPGAEAHE